MNLARSKLILPHTEFASPEFALAGDELTGHDAVDVILREIDCRHAFSIESYAIHPEPKVETVKSILLAMVGKIIGINGNDVQEESCLRICLLARFLDIGDGIFAEIYVKVGTEDRFSGHN